MWLALGESPANTTLFAAYIKDWRLKPLVFFSWTRAIPGNADNTGDASARARISLLVIPFPTFPPFEVNIEERL
jgi:hypothetical protein